MIKVKFPYFTVCVSCILVSHEPSCSHEFSFHWISSKALAQISKQRNSLCFLKLSCSHPPYSCKNIKMFSECSMHTFKNKDVTTVKSTDKRKWVQVTSGEILVGYKRKIFQNENNQPLDLELSPPGNGGFP